MVITESNFTRRAMIGGVATGVALAAVPARAGDDDTSSPYNLVIEQRKIVETREAVAVPNPLGCITSGKGGRMLVVFVSHPRPKPEAIRKITDQELIELLRTMTADGRTHKFDGKTVEH